MERLYDGLDERCVSVCFTGHRTIPSGDDGRRLMGMVDAMIAAAVSHGYRHFITGGAVGFDTLAACRVAVAKKRIPDVYMHLALPCRNQTEKWKRTEDIVLYKRLLAVADRVDYISDFYTSSCMLERNRYMVDRSGLCIAYCTKSTGGSAYTLRYAASAGIGIINLGENSYSVSEFDKFRLTAERGSE